MTGMMKKLEERFGLPSLDSVMELVNGKTGQNLDRLLGRLEKLAGDKDSVKDVKELLDLLKVLDERGTLERLSSILDALPKGKNQAAVVALLTSLVERLDRGLKLLEAFKGE